MTTISGIQSSYASLSATDPNNRRDKLLEGAANRNTGPDTVSLSTEALQLALLTGEDTGVVEEAEATFRETLNESSSSAKQSRKTEGGKNFFAMLMESLFLADLEEAGAGQASEQGGGQADETMPEQAAPPKKSVNPLQDGEKAAALKKVVNDVMTGKADLSDLPKAMATGASGGKAAGAAGGRSDTGAAAAKNDGGLSGSEHNT